MSENQLFYQQLQQGVEKEAAKSEESRKLSDTSFYYLQKLYQYFKYRRPYLTAEELNYDELGEFIFGYLFTKLKYCDIKSLRQLLNFIKNSLKSSNPNLHKEMTSLIKIWTAQAERISTVKSEFRRYLNDPVVEYSPLIIDLKRYRNRSQMEFNNACFPIDMGRFTLVEFLTDNAVILKKTGGGFYKVSLDRRLIAHLKKDDSFRLKLRKKPYISWEVEELTAYYPAN